MDFERLFRSLPPGVVLLDRTGRVVVCNEAGGRIIDRRVEEMEGRDFFEVAQGADVQELAETFRKTMQDDGASLDEDTDFAFALPDRKVNVRLRIRKILLAGEPHAILVIDDTSRIKRAFAAALSEAEDKAARDPLTGLYNRRHLEAVLPKELSRAQRYDVPLSVLVLDVDHFKSVNDRFGHAVGDCVLVRLAGVMGRVLRTIDTCGRLGGEEFCVVLPHSDSAAALRASERLHRVIRALRFDEEPDLRVTVSIGVATAQAADRTEDFEAQVKRLFAQADEALYEAKRTGRDRTVVRS